MDDFLYYVILQSDIVINRLFYGLPQSGESVLK